MAHASPFAARSWRRRIAAAVSAMLLVTPVTAQEAERFGPFTVATEVQRVPMSDITRPTVRLAWLSADKRFEVSLLDTGTVLMAQLRARDASGKVRCSSNGPFFVYDSGDWMELRWRTLIEQHGNFLRTCHILDRRMAGTYRAPFGRDAAGVAAPLAALKSAAREAFGDTRARCLDVRDRVDPVFATRADCEAMVSRS